jgi:hypothetical protein
MNTNSYFKKLLAFTLATGHFVTSVAFAEDKSETLRLPAGMQVEEIENNKSYKLVYGSQNLSLDFIEGEDERVLINNKSYSITLNDDRKKLEQDLKAWLETEEGANQKTSLLEYWMQVLSPKAYAFNWWAAGLFAVAAIGIIIAVKAKTKTRDNRAEIRDNRARIHNNHLLKRHNERHLAFLKEGNAQSSSSSSNSSSSASSSSTSSDSYNEVNSFQIRDESH